MSRDFHAYIEHYNYNTRKWEAVLLYKKVEDDFQEIPFIEGGWGEAQDILTTSELTGVHPIVQDILSPEVNSHVQQYLDADAIFGLRMVNLADIKIYVLQNPLSSTFDDEEEYDENNIPPVRDNPLLAILDAAVQYIKINNDTAFYIDSLSDYRMVYWGDC